MTMITSATTDSTTGLSFLFGTVDDLNNTIDLIFEETDNLRVVCTMVKNSNKEISRSFHTLNDSEDFGDLISNYGCFNVLSYKWTQDF